ncbi:MAG: hypothetical protein IJH13_01120 [Bacilli bacterium]|nr:hypothetical protein [Bacilli bacterium]
MKKNVWIIIIIAFIVLLSTVVIVLFNANENSIPSGYIAVFKGESTDVVHTTYLYQGKKNKKKYSYINTITKLDHNDSSMWNEEVLEQKKLKKKKDVFKVAKENGAYSYVKYEKDGNLYTIEEFKKVF